MSWLDFLKDEIFHTMEVEFLQNELLHNCFRIIQSQVIELSFIYELLRDQKNKV